MSCVKVEVAVLGSHRNKPAVSVDVKQHSAKKRCCWGTGYAEAGPMFCDDDMLPMDWKRDGPVYH